MIDMIATTTMNTLNISAMMAACSNPKVVLAPLEGNHPFQPPIPCRRWHLVR